MRSIRIFVSSPADVEFERQRVDRVAQRLNGVFADIAQLETIRWEKKFYSADKGFQPQIADASDCDLVIAIFWSRLGSPLPDDFIRMPTGEPYPSGTAFEVLRAIEARRRGERPDVYVFRKTEPPVHRIDRENELDAAKTQLRNLNAFFERWFHTAEGVFLAAYHQFATTDEFEDQIEALLRGWIVDHIPHSRSVVWPIETMGSPFRALLPFDARHAPVYFGRDRKVTRAIEQLKGVALGRRSAATGPPGVPFLLIVGESGAGKSSLMRAGVAPQLTAPGATPGIDLWRIAVVRIGDQADPFATLAKSLLVNGKTDDEGGFGPALPELATGRHGTPEQLADLLATGGNAKAGRMAPAAFAIVSALAQAAHRARQQGGFRRRVRANVLILLDQLENIFGAEVTDDQRQAFARLVFALCSTRRIWVAATLRSDLYGRMITRGDFIALKDAGALYDLAAPGESELTEIVHKSAALTGLVYEKDAATGEGLDERILADAQGENTLPLLEFTLDRLFKDREVVDGETRLTFAAYAAMGGLDGAIDRTAEHALGTLGEREIAALPRLLRALAAPVHDRKTGSTGSGELAARPVPARDAVPDDAARRLVDSLIEARIVVTTASLTDGAAGEDGQVAIAHQRVLESWKRARRIVEDHRDFFRIRDEVEMARQRWHLQGRPAALLLPKGVPLAEGERIVGRYGAELSAEVREFVAASTRRAQRNQRILAAVAACFAVLFVGATGAGILAYTAKQEAEYNYTAAKQTVDDLISTIAKGLGNLVGVPVKTVDAVLNIVDGTIKRLQAASHGDPQLDRSRAGMLYQFAKTYQKINNHPGAIRNADQSLALRIALTGYDRLKASPARFGAVPGELRWELSESIELVGDLKREDKLFEEARSRYGEALAIRRQLSAQVPTNNEWAYGISLSYVRLGDLDMPSNLPSAKRNYDAALANAAEIFSRAPNEVRWQRELSWGFNKVGDVALAAGELKLKAGDITARADLTAALDAFGNSLCIRRRLDEQQENNTQLKTDISYSLDRIGKAKRGLDDLPGAEAAYFESLAIRRTLYQGDVDNAQLLGDIATSLELIGLMFAERHRAGLSTASFATNPDERSDPQELSLSFLEAAVDARLQLQLQKPDDARAQQNLATARTKAEAVRAQFDDKSRLAAFTGSWWRDRVRAAEDAAAKRRSADHDTKACWSHVESAVAQIAGPAHTASTK